MILDIWILDIWRNFVQKKIKLEGSNKGKQYKLFKDNIELETYLITLPIQFVFPLLKFRSSNQKKSVETGRWSNTPYHERFCRFCRNDIGDSFHYLLVCKRKLLIDK